VGATRRRMAGVVDPRLLAYARGTRRYLVAVVVLGGLTAALVVAQAWLIADCVSRAVGGHRTLTDLRRPLVLLALVIVSRSVLGWLGETMADRASAAAKSDLRRALVERVALLGPTGVDRESPGRLVALAATGIDALDGYFARYLPQLFLAVIVPVTVFLVVLGTAWIPALIIAVTVPLIPVFVSLVGTSSRGRMRRQAQLLQRLAGHFLDVVAGLPTLKVFGRAKAQEAAIRDITDRYRRATMSTLKIAFLSSLILELLATFSVALVAVAVGLRLLGGELTFDEALFVLILAPEAYLPLRLLGTNYHASAEGLRAAEEVFEVLERPLPTRGTDTAAPDPARFPLGIGALEVVYPGRTTPALRDFSLVVEPGEVVAITGPSGCGKTTLLNVLLGLAPPWSGSVTVGDTDLRDLDPDAWRRQLAWVPQRPHLFARSVADNIRLGNPDATDDEVTAAIEAAGLRDVVAGLTEGRRTVLGADGAGLSAGERQRVAIARAFIRDAPLLLLDEPTASLDARTEAGVLDTLRALMAGRTVLLVAHRPTLMALADRVIELAPVPA
jgi:ATP-binding cassette, subfamily C, bacterial CydCD